MFLIYDDLVHNNGPLYRFLNVHFPETPTKFVTAAEILCGLLAARPPAAFFMPGGASRYVSDKMRGAGNAAIRAYVENGGVYVGICAGAYYACADIQWNKRGATPLSASGELNFVAGTAVGPIEDFCTRDGDELNTARVVAVDFADGTRANALYWGGPALPNAGGHDVLARYADGTPAMVGGRHGLGRFLLTSPHCEIDAGDLALRQFDLPMNRYACLAELDARRLDAAPLFAAEIKRAMEDEVS